MKLTTHHIHTLTVSQWVSMVRNSIKNVGHSHGRDGTCADANTQSGNQVPVGRVGFLHPTLVSGDFFCNRANPH